MIDSDELFEKMKKIRNASNRKEISQKIMYLLEYEKHEDASQDDLDALLIWSIEQHFGHSINADILLVAFGLLDGYHYSQANLGERRGEYLINSNVAKIVLKIDEDYVNVSVVRQKKIRNWNLRQAEDTRIKGLADFLTKYLMNHDVDSLMSNLKKNHTATLPKPSYLLYKDARIPKTVNDEDSGTLEQKAALDAREDPQSQNRLHPEIESKPKSQQESPDTEPSSSPGQELPREKCDDKSILKKLRIFVKIALDSTFFSHNTTNIHFNIFNPSPTDSKRRQMSVLYCCIMIALLLLIFGGYHFIRQRTMPPVSELFPTADEIILSPNQIYELKVAILPDEAVGAPLNYVSLNPTVATVSNKGFVLAHDIPQGAGCYTTDILIQAESGVTATKPVTVKISDDVSFPPVVSDIDNYKPGFTIEQEVRLAGDKEWRSEIDAKVGDRVEFLITYKNTSSEVQRDVMLQDILPKNMCYIPDSTFIYNGDHNGWLMTDDKITDTGVNIGNYSPGVTAHVRFTAEIIDNTLQHGGNVLRNWSQCSISPASLQDYTIVYVHKD